MSKTSEISRGVIDLINPMMWPKIIAIIREMRAFDQNPLDAELSLDVRKLYKKHNEETAQELLVKWAQRLTHMGIFPEKASESGVYQLSVKANADGSEYVLTPFGAILLVHENVPPLRINGIQYTELAYFAMVKVNTVISEYLKTQEPRTA